MTRWGDNGDDEVQRRRPAFMSRLTRMLRFPSGWRYGARDGEAKREDDERWGRVWRPKEEDDEW